MCAFLYTLSQKLTIIIIIVVILMEQLRLEHKEGINTTATTATSCLDEKITKEDLLSLGKSLNCVTISIKQGSLDELTAFIKYAYKLPPTTTSRRRNKSRK